MSASTPTARPRDRRTRDVVGSRESAGRDAHSRQEPRRWLIGLVSFVVFFVVSASWALSNPIGASPDEPAHFVKAASVVRGQLIGEATDRPPVKAVQVPAGIAYTGDAICYAHQPTVTADCSPGFPTDPAELVDATTSAGLYNPVFYVLVGWPSLVVDGKLAIFGMRFMSVLLCSAFFSLAMTSLSRLSRPVLPMVAAAASVTPTMWFLTGSVNPNGLEAVVALTFAAAYFAILTSARGVPVPRRLLVVLALSGMLFVHVRGLSPLWMAIVVVAGVVFVGWRRFVELVTTRRVLVAVGGIAVSTAFALVWAAKSNSVPSVGEFPGQGTTFAGGFTKMLEMTVDYGLGMVGSLGWLDTAAPLYAIYAFLVASFVLVVVPLLAPGRRLPRAAVGLLFAAFLFGPPLVQAATVTESGYVWQGRYTLPLYMGLVVAAAIAAAPLFDRLPVALGRRIVNLVLVAYPVAVVASELTFLKRNSVGLPSSWVAMLTDPAWHPPGASVPVWTALIVLAGAVLLVGIWWVVREADRPATSAVGSSVPRDEALLAPR